MNTKAQMTERSERVLQLLRDHVAHRLKTELSKWQIRPEASAAEKNRAKSKQKTARERFVLEEILKRTKSRSAGISIATHIAKGIHKDLHVNKSTNLLIDPRALPNRAAVGSHLLEYSWGMAAATGNGRDVTAAHDAYLLLGIEFEGRPLSQWVEKKDADVMKAIGHASGSMNETQSVVHELHMLMSDKCSNPATDTKAKQFFWLVGDDPTKNQSFHLLAPLYPAALVNTVDAHISPNTWFFGSNNAKARKARRDNKPSEHGFVSYPNLAFVKLGGENAQNISNFNVRRRGKNYLLASLPPTWVSRTNRAPMQNAFRAFGNRHVVRKTLAELKRFLNSYTAPNMRTRNELDNLTKALGDEMMLFTIEVRLLTPGWTADEQCRIVPAEQFWLDPGRAYTDTDFDEARRQSDWPDEIGQRAARWLNHELGRRSKLKLGDDAYRYWKHHFDHVMNRLRREIGIMQDVLCDEANAQERI